MTPDSLHYVFVAIGWIAVPVFLLAAIVFHRRVSSRWSLLLVVGLCVSLFGQAAQQFAPIHDLPYDEFKGIVVSTGRLPVVWYLGSLLSALGWLMSAAGALGVALHLEPRSGSDP